MVGHPSPEVVLLMGGGVSIWDSLVISLKDGVQDCGVTVDAFTTVSPDLPPDHIKYLDCIALMAEQLMAVVMFTVFLLSKELCDELCIEGRYVGHLPTHLVCVPLWQLITESNFGFLQLILFLV